jgi:hypothetical protein
MPVMIRETVGRRTWQDRLLPAGGWGISNQKGTWIGIHISLLYILTIMRSIVCACLGAVLVVLLVSIAGCTSSPTGQNAGAGTPAAGASPTSTPAPGTPGASASSAQNTGIDTTIAVHYNDYACINLPQEMGMVYLNPGQQFTVWATSPGPGTINANVLVVDFNDNTKLIAVKPQWDPVQKTWDYPGIVPLVQLNSVTSPQQGTFTIKKQGAYYLCVDDRVEAAGVDTIYQVPVKVTPS